MNRVVLSLGSNIGDRTGNLKLAINLLEGIPCKLLKESSVYETAPWGNTDQSSFYNQVIEIETTISPQKMMEEILLIEEKMGRMRKQKWEPRIIDIDILFFNREKINSEQLVVPHPHLHERRFVLEPLNEILPEKKHPVLKKTISELLLELKDKSTVEKLKTIPQE